MSYRIRYGKRKTHWQWWGLGLGVLAVCAFVWQYEELARYVGGMILGPR